MTLDTRINISCANKISLDAPNYKTICVFVNGLETEINNTFFICKRI